MKHKKVTEDKCVPVLKHFGMKTCVGVKVDSYAVLNFALYGGSSSGCIARRYKRIRGPQSQS